jgi:hypothetical protein
LSPQKEKIHYFDFVQHFGTLRQSPAAGRNPFNMATANTLIATTLWTKKISKSEQMWSSFVNVLIK